LHAKEEGNEGEPMKQFTYTIKDELGVHARPAGLLVKLAKKYASNVTIEKDGKTCDMRKLMAVMGLGIKQGETITVTVEGEDETVAAEEIAAFLNENV
jgi:phosphocarrier protein HPr